MQPTIAMQAAASVQGRIFPSVVLLCLAVSGCNTCYSGFWNGNGSGVTVSNRSCPLTTATGTVSVQMGTASAPSTASRALPSPLLSPGAIQHIFVTLRGIEARPGMASVDASSGWQELVPHLAKHPVQLDLLALDGNSRLPGSPAGANVAAIVPADEYRELRLLLVPPHPFSDDLIAESNACGNVGWSCIVFADRSVRPLECNAAAPEFRIIPERGSDSLFRLLPEEVIHLSIEFDASASAFFASNAPVCFVPVFKVVSRSSSPAAN
jgi:hypothetical protein